MAQYRSLVSRMAKDASAYNIKSELKELRMATQKPGVHAVELVGANYHAGLLRWLATIAAIYLIVLDRTNWRTNMMTTLLVPYIFLNSPSTLFNFFRGEVGRWIAFIAVVLQLFFPQKHFPMWLELPGALILLLVVAPNLLAHAFRNSIFAIIVSLLIGAYLFQQHIRAAGGFRNAFAEKHGISNTLGIILLFVSPLWELINAL